MSPACIQTMLAIPTSMMSLVVIWDGTFGGRIRANAVLMIFRTAKGQESNNFVSV